jgi:lysozyme
MTSWELAAKLIRVFEGLKLKSYPDSGGLLTIGFGHTKDVKEGDVCTLEQAIQWLQEDMQGPAGLVKDLPPLAAAAYLSFGYNCGVGALAKVLTGKASLRDFVHDRKGAELPGLVARRDLEAALIEFGG